MRRFFVSVVLSLALASPMLLPLVCLRAPSAATSTVSRSGTLSPLSPIEALSLTTLPARSVLAGPPAVSTTTASPSVPSPASSSSPTTPPLDTVTPQERIEWTRVAICEEGGWVGYSGAAYPDSLGISAANWWAYGGTSNVSEDAQIMVAERIQTDPPDQDGCAAW